MASLRLRDTVTGAEKSPLAVRGLFYGIGHTPNSTLLKGQLQLDEAGFVKARMDG